MIIISIKFIIKGSEERERERDELKESNAVLFFSITLSQISINLVVRRGCETVFLFSLDLSQNRIKNDGISDNAQRSPFLFSRSELNFKQGAAYKLRGCVNLR